MRYITITLWLMLMSVFACTALAGPSSHRIKDGPGLFDVLGGADEKPLVSDRHEADHAIAKPVQAGLFDGVWRDQDGRLLMLKQIHRSLFLSGNSADVAWQARCMLTAATARCMGSGMSRNNAGFSYQSDIKMSGMDLQIDWTFYYHSGATRVGHSNYKKTL